MRLIVALLAGVALLAAACEDVETVTEPDEPDAEAGQADDESDQEPADEPDEGEPAEPADEPAQEDESQEEEVTARVGDSITLTGQDEAEVRVAVLEVIDPATPELGEGRHIGVRLELENVGDAATEQHPANMVLIIDGERQQHSATVVPVNECEDFGGSVRLPPGDTRVGCVAFELDEALEPATVQVTLDSGFAAQTGVWEL